MKNNLQISTSPVTSYNLFNTEVSFYIHKVDKAPKRRKLAAVLEDASRANEINRIREVLRAQGKEAYSAEKLKVPCFLVSVQCEGGHSKSCIVGYTGLLAFDLDAKDNPNWTPDEIKECLAGYVNVAYCGLSLSGNGVWGIVPIAYPEKHIEHFNSLSRIFAQIGVRWKGIPLIIDRSCRNPNRLRFQCFDPNPVWREDAVVFNRVDEPRCASTKDHTKTNNSSKVAKEENPLCICIRLIDNAIDGEKHFQLLKASRLAGGFIAGGLVEEDIAVIELENAIGRKPNVNDFEAAKRTIQAGINNGKLDPILNYYQPTLKEESISPTVAISSTDDLSDSQFPTELNGEQKTFASKKETQDGYPSLWDEPYNPNTKPAIRVLSFHEWQKQHPSFKNLGLSSL